MSIASEARVSLPGSARDPRAGATRIGVPESEQSMQVTLLLRRRPGGAPLPGMARRSERPKALSREDFASRYGAEQTDLDEVAAFADQHDLTVVESSLGGRRAVLSGKVRDVEAAFGVMLGTYEAEGVRYRGFEGAASLPAGLGSVVEHVVGLDDRPVSRPMVRAAGAPALTTAMSPITVAQLYRFPTLSAKGQTIGIMEFGGGFLDSDLHDYFVNIAEVPVPTVTAISVDGAANIPPVAGSIADADHEVALDIQVAGAIAPEATIAVYFAPNNEQGFVDAFSTALHDQTNKPSVLSLSWYGAENSLAGWVSSLTSVLADAQSLGVTILVCSGDGGAGAPVEVGYPTSDPNVLGCGGTTLSNVSGAAFSETAWSGSGGGVSNTFSVPGWQSKISMPPSLNPAGHLGRGVPDIAGNADPASGYEIIVAGASAGIWGGTSAVPPLYAGLIARLNAGAKEPAGYLNADLYAWAAGTISPFSDVTSGNNDTSGVGYSAGTGWDAVTGLGSLNGTALYTLLADPCAPQQQGLAAAEDSLNDAPLPGEIPGQTPAQYKAMIARLEAAVRAAEKAVNACEAVHGAAARQEASQVAQ